MEDFDVRGNQFLVQLDAVHSGLTVYLRDLLLALGPSTEPLIRQRPTGLSVQESGFLNFFLPFL